MNQIAKSKKDCRGFIQESVVVEGKTDTEKLKKLFHVNTIETNGSALDKNTINLIKKAAESTGVILFLDPDYQGRKIRNTIIRHLKSFKECFIKTSDMVTGSKKIGIAEANDEAILNAFSKHVKKFDKRVESISWNEYLDLKLNSKQIRAQLCDVLKIGYFNHKQLYKQLNMLQINLEEVQTILLKLHENKKLI
ncbi:ribonuclease M5 [[Mycoplasma] testudinis]|uniref:ribonuclease M5 n=1 Tax=[Mycoplasma] testudinis TaxID=33924 RepID=UPI00055FC20F|nr:ribonuclease M5 [[Mycoplasma] testudinis]